jgi:hypothetical protein
MFRPTSGSGKRPVLRPFYRFFDDTSFFHGFLIVGTVLSTKEVEPAVGLLSAKRTTGSQALHVVFNTNFSRDSNGPQTAYVRKYLTLSDNCSDRRLLERIRYWFSGRCVCLLTALPYAYLMINYSPRLTASPIELLLYSDDLLRHRILSAFVRHFTGFTLLDAMDLENDEKLIPEEVTEITETYGLLIPLNAFSGQVLVRLVIQS